MAKERELRDKVGPLPPEAFENDALSNGEPDTRLAAQRQCVQLARDVLQELIAGRLGRLDVRR
jgi:hypothetical protein